MNADNLPPGVRVKDLEDGLRWGLPDTEERAAEEEDRAYDRKKDRSLFPEEQTSP